MKTTTSMDGTKIAYEQMGSGPPLILVDGACCSRSFGPMPKLAPLLADRFTVIHYDRRGRGDSGNALPYAREREIEDLQALFAVVGGSAYLYGTSSGAVLAARTAPTVNVKGLMLYEPPLSLDGTRFPNPPDFRERIAGAIAEDRPGDAMKIFMKVVGVPAFGILFMQLMPGVWKPMKKVAPTLNYDFAILGDTQSGGPMPQELVDTLASIRAPTMVMFGGKSPPYMAHAAKRVAELIPNARTSTLAGQDHNVSEKAMAPAIAALFAVAPATLGAAA